MHTLDIPWAILQFPTNIPETVCTSSIVDTYTDYWCYNFQVYFNGKFKVKIKLELLHLLIVAEDLV